MAIQLLGIKTKFTDDNGRPLIGGRVHTYAAGTDLAKDTFKDADFKIANTNPIILDDSGSADIFLDGAYWIRVFDKNYKFVEEQDNLRQPVGLAEFEAYGFEISEQINSAKTDIEAVKEKTMMLESVSELPAFINPKAGLRIYVKSYHAGLGIGGGYFVYDSTKANINDSGLVINGWKRQLETSYVIPEHFGAKANTDFDNADALNKAFATGFDVYSTPDKTYTVKQRLKSKGQKTVGGFKILVNRDAGRDYTLNESVVTNNTDNRDDSIKILYVESAWDLAEFLIIKSLGFNIIHHYCGFANYAGDNTGTVQQMLDNAKTAGLQVSLGTEQHPDAKRDLLGFIRQYDSHPMVWGYSVYDEPKYRGFSVADQDNRINQLRQATAKKLFAVDFAANPFEKYYSTNYDSFFVDSYGRAANTLEQDVVAAREAFGIIKAQTKTNVIPCIAAFIYNGVLSSDINKILNFAKTFAKAGDGNYAMFVWDGIGDTSITKAVRDNDQLRLLCKSLADYRSNRPSRTDTYLFGYADGQYDYGLNDILKNIVPTDKFSSLDTTFNAYPVKVIKEAENTDRTTTANVPTISGVYFKTDYARFATTIPLYDNITLYMEYAYPEATSVDTVVKVCASRDSLKIEEIRYYIVTQPYQIIRDSFATINKSFSNLVFEFRDRNPTKTQYYRQSIRGIIIVTNW